MPHRSIRYLGLPASKAALLNTKQYGFSRNGLGSYIANIHKTDQRTSQDKKLYGFDYEDI